MKEEIENIKKFGIFKLTIIIFLVVLAFIINQWSISIYSQEENINLVNFCKDSYRNETFIDLFYDKEPHVLKTCYDRVGKDIFRMDSEDYKENYCPEITEEQLRFSKSCYWMGVDYFLLVLRVFGGFVLPAMLLSIAFGISFSNLNKNEIK